MSATGLPLQRLLQLASPMLPVGAYSYSQALEWGVDAGRIHDRDSAGIWIGDALRGAIGTLEAPVWVRLYRAWEAGADDDVVYWNAFFNASRETRELRAETAQMGYSLVRLLEDAQWVGGADLAVLARLQPVTFPAAFTCAALRLGIGLEDGLAGYLWAWLEGQVTAAMKSVPLGQVAGQTLLMQLSAGIPALCATALAMPDADLSNFMPGLALASSLHETQYSRLFRS